MSLFLTIKKLMLKNAIMYITFGNMYIKLGKNKCSCFVAVEMYEPLTYSYQVVYKGA